MADATQKGILLLVDDDKILLKLLGRILSKAYEVSTASSAELALELLDGDLDPALIISDQEMPGLKGAEFLSKCVTLRPNAIRILLTGHSEPKTIIALLNEAKAYMFITKPWKNLELFQSAHVAYEHYKDTMRIETGSLSTAEPSTETSTEQLEGKKEKSLTGDIGEMEKNINELEQKLEAKNQEFSKLVEVYKANDKFPIQVTASLSGLVEMSNPFFFTNHATSTSAILKSIATDLKWNSMIIKELMSAGFLHSMSTVGMPDSLKIQNPNELEEDLRGVYFKYFLDAIVLMSKIDFMKNQALFSAQMWEHYDGSGFPTGVEHEAFNHGSQLLALANLYHFMVYGLTQEQYVKVKQIGVITQTAHETAEKHKLFLKYIIKRGKWYDPELFHAFQDLIRSKECTALVPKSRTLTLDLRAYFGKSTVGLAGDVAGKDESSGGKEKSGNLRTARTASSMIMRINNKDILVNEKHLTAAKLEAGIYLGHDIFDEDHDVVCRKNDLLDDEAIERIQALKAYDGTSKVVVVYIEVE